MKKIILFFLVQSFFNAILTAQNPTAVYKIHPQPIHEKPVNPLIYGNFIELGLARQIEGLWAEKLYNASFEDVPPLKSYMYDWLGKSPADDLSREKWWHSGYEINDWYVWPAVAEVKQGTNRYWNFHHGLQAAVLENGQKAGQAFLAQDGIWIDSGVRYLFRGYFSNNQTADTNPNPVKVTIGLYSEKQIDKPLAEQTIIVPDGIFREFSVELDLGSYKGRATFAASIEPGTRAAMDGFSLMPMNSEKGWRGEVVEVLRKIHVPMIRFPGGCFASFYDWREGVGPRLDRQPVESEYWGGIEENHAGTVEFIELCRMIGAEPFLCVNILTGTADRAADWVAYCNGSAESGLGSLRKQHGYPDPFKIKYWELDNEAYRRFGWEEYAKRCVEYSRSMKSQDPDIKLVMVGYWRYNSNLKEMLEIAGRYIDVITDRATSEVDLRRDLVIIREYNQKNGTRITLSNTEWLAPLDWSKTSLDALNFQKSPNQMTLQEHEITWNYAINAARQLLLFQRLGGDFEFASFNNLGNTWGQNIIECPKDTVFISAAGRIFELMSRSPLRWVIKTDTIQNLPGVFIQAGVSQIPNPKEQKTNKFQNTKLKTPNGTSATLTTAPSSVIPANAGTPSLTTDPLVIPAKAGTPSPVTEFPDTRNLIPDTRIHP
ncbi:MAG: hypothetical protein NTV01_19175, partial [Bacteroidia bacterium]|nr:hypothetical protein [Bacteroidia bacterium]